MNNSSVNQDTTVNGSSFQFPMGYQRAGQIGKALFFGGASGLVDYGIMWVATRLSGGSESIRVTPFILFGVAAAAIIEGVSLTYEVALHALGDRQVYENFSESKKASRTDRLRQHSWKVIGRIGKVQEDVDALFSRILRIRTAKQIREDKIPHRDLFLTEIARRALGEQVKVTAKAFISQELGIAVVEKCGYSLGGVKECSRGQLIIVFALGLIQRIGLAWEIKKQEVELKKIKNKISELKKLPKKELDNVGANYEPLDKMQEEKRKLKENLQELYKKASAL